MEIKAIFQRPLGVTVPRSRRDANRAMFKGRRKAAANFEISAEAGSALKPQTARPKARAENNTRPWLKYQLTSPAAARAPKQMKRA
jgi:hypothetical protein